MCDPITIAGAALTAAGTAANYVASSKINAARDDVLAAERIRQRGYDQQADAINNTARGRYEGFGDKQETTAGTLGEMYREASNTPPSAPENSVMPTSSSNITVNEENARRADAKAFTDNQANALGVLRSFGELFGGISRDTARDAGEIGQIGGFKRGSSSIVPFELEEANKAGSGLSLFGDLLTGAGQVGMTAGLSGAKLPSWLGGGGPIKLTGAVKPSAIGALYTPAAAAGIGPLY